MAKSLIDVLRENQIELESSSQERWVAVCPFHEGDRDPSFTVYPTNTYYCWGCEAWGNAVTFLVNYKHMTAKEALEYVGEDFIFPKADKAQVIKVKNVSLTWEFLNEVTETYANYLIRTPGALNYLQRRGLTLDTIQKYKLGYTDGHVLNLYFKHERELAAEVGLVNRSGYEALSHRITIPNIINTGSGVDFIIGRTVINDPIKYLGIRAPKPLFGFWEVRHSPILYVVEGQIDWLLLRQWGYPAVNLSGTHVPQYIKSLLKDKFIIIVPDFDESGVGMKAATSLASVFPDKSLILDYSRYKEEGEKLDIGSLGERPNGETMFAEVVQENLWNIPISTKISPQSLGNLIRSQSSPLILNRRA